MPPSLGSSSIVGCILAGGQSRRMGGGDKALLDLAGRPILAHVMERLIPQVSRVALNTNAEAARFEGFGLPVVADTIGGHLGPLAGILAGLTWARDHAPGTTHVLTVSADAPFIPRDLAARLSAEIAGQPGKIAIAASSGQPQPVMGLWPVSISDDLEVSLRAGARSVLAWCSGRQAVQVDFPAESIGGRAIDPFFNANSPIELAQARIFLQRMAFHSPVIGIAGWKNSGKTTLVTRLIQELSLRGRQISTIKFSHHQVTIGTEVIESERVRDTSRHAAAGARQVAFAGSSRWGIVEGGEASETWHLCSADRDTVLAAIVAAMAPADLIVLEGYKGAPIPKIEVRRLAQADKRSLAQYDSYVFAIASDYPVEANGPWLVGIDCIGAIAGQLERLAGLCGSKP
ncbi:MAG: molybdenum cofactor guanylyltransferase MobA [Hyphomicrobium sp.]